MGGIERMSEEFGVRTVDAGNDVIVVVAGDVDIESQARLRRAIDRARARGRRLVVDLAHTRFVDRTAVEELLRAHLAQACTGTTMVLRSPSDRLMRMVRVLGLHTVFHVEPRPRRRQAGTPPEHRATPAGARDGAAPPDTAHPPPSDEPEARRRAGEGSADDRAGRHSGTASGGGAGGHGSPTGDGWRPGERGHGPGERAHGAGRQAKAHDHAGRAGAAGPEGEDGAERPPALPRRVPGLAWPRRGPDGAHAPGPPEADPRAGGDDPAPLASLPAGQAAVVTPEAAELMGRFAQACEALADAAEAAARLQARLAEPWWPIEVREVEVARYLARANEARRRARLVAAQLAASTVTP